MYLLLRFSVEKVIGFKITAGKSAKNAKTKNAANAFFGIVINLNIGF